MKEIIIGFILLAVLIAVAMFISGGKNKADLSSDYEERSGQYQEGSGTGHPLWR